MYIFEQKFAVEIEEKGHTDRNQEKEYERQTKTENHSDCKFFRRINADAEGFDSFVEISKICNYISQSNKEKKIKEQENKIKEQERKIKEKREFSKELLIHVSSIFMPVKHIKYFLKKKLAALQSRKNTQSKIKPIKIGKSPGTTYCFGCKYFTHNFRP